MKDELRCVPQSFGKIFLGVGGGGGREGDSCFKLGREHIQPCG